MVWMNDLAVVVLIFGNLVYNTHMLPSTKTSNRTFKEEIGKVVGKYSSLGSNGTPSRVNNTNSNSRSPTNVVPAAMLTEEADPESPVITLTRPHRNELPSSLSMETEQVEAAFQSSLLGCTPLQERERISSLSLLSTDGTGSQKIRGSDRSVTFGMVFYSEGNEDGSELAVPLPMAVEEPIRGRRMSYESIARFSTDSNDGAPPRLPRRLVPSSTDSLEELLKTEPELTTDQTSSAKLIPSNNGRRQRPNRILSTTESTEENNLACSKECGYGNVENVYVMNASASRKPSPPRSPPRQSDNNGPPQRPFRLDSHAELSDDDLEEAADIHAVSHVPTLRQVSSEFSPPSMPERIESLAELSNDNDSSAQFSNEDDSSRHVAIRISPAIEKSSCPTTRPKLDNQGPPQTPVRSDSSAELIDDDSCSDCDHVIGDSSLPLDGNCAQAGATNLIALDSASC
jgi:hypothetical protein